MKDLAVEDAFFSFLSQARQAERTRSGEGQMKISELISDSTV